MRKYERIKELCRAKGVTVAKVEKDCGFAKGSLSKIDKHKPSYDKLATLSEYFSTPVFDLLFDDETGASDLKTMREYQQRFDRHLDESSLDKAKEVIRNAHVYEVAAGQGRINDGLPEETIEVGKDKDCGYIKVCGDSMLPTLHEGDICKVDHSINDDKKIDYAVVKVNGDEITIKHIEITDTGVWLRAEKRDNF